MGAISGRGTAPSLRPLSRVQPFGFKTAVENLPLARSDNCVTLRAAKSLVQAGTDSLAYFPPAHGPETKGGSLSGDGGPDQYLASGVQPPLPRV